MNLGTRCRWQLIVLLVFFGLALVGCGGTTASAPPPAATSPAPAETTLTVFAAASLTDVFGEVATAFTAANPGVTVVFNFAGSNQLATQIGAGAPADVFASAHRSQMDAAVKAGHVDDSAPQIFVTNRLVIVVPADNPAGLVELTDLARPGIILVLAAREVPAGQYTLEFLDKASAAVGIGATFGEDVLANVVSYEENVRSVLNKVALGEADAGVVYTSDAMTEPGVAIIGIPDALNVPAEYPIAVLNDSVHGDEAAAFVAFVLGPEGQAILTRDGFGAPAGQ